ncbi:hypothetical protein OG21DRAFT_1588320 [Imleria badia]|nr:hypothetical protein OG21DRAFT_1588320 [Imleria badia]
MIGLESTWWRWDTSNQAREHMVEVGHKRYARIDTVGVADEQSGSKAHGGGGARVVVLELMRWACRRAIGLESAWWRHSGGGRQVVRLEVMWWRQETSVPAQIDMVGVEDKQSGSRVHSGALASTGQFSTLDSYPNKVPSCIALSGLEQIVPVPFQSGKCQTK